MPAKNGPLKKRMGKDLRPSPCVYQLVSRQPPAHAPAAATGHVHYAASAPLAFSVRAVNPAASCTAMSASTLRSRVMPALSRPFMKRL